MAVLIMEYGVGEGVVVSKLAETLCITFVPVSSFEAKPLFIVVLARPSRAKEWGEKLFQRFYGSVE
jgi:hypothetical protein